MIKKRQLHRTIRTLLFITGSFLLALHVVAEPLRFFPGNSIISQNSREIESKEDFLRVLSPSAQSIQKETGVPASISLSQAILESDWGMSGLAQENKNLYGIKGDESDSYYFTQEFVGNNYITVEAPFRSYNSYYEAMADHAELLTNGTSWNALQYEKVATSDSYVSAAYALQEAGYATDPHYAEKLIQLIEEYALYRYDIR